ncbi:MAG: RidA family protein [Deltaproteobacteria bacterium]
MAGTIVKSDALAKPKGYANGVIAEGRLLFVAGQIGWDREGRLAEGFAAQFARALDNVLEVIRAAGGAPTDLCRMTVYVTDKRAYEAAAREIGAAWRARLGRHYPAMTLVEVRSLLEDRAEVELEATAALAGERVGRSAGGSRRLANPMGTA